MSRMKIEDVQSQERVARVAAHTHVKGLGLNELGVALDVAAGLVGQKTAREVHLFDCLSSLLFPSLRNCFPYLFTAPLLFLSLSLSVLML